MCSCQLRVTTVGAIGPGGVRRTIGSRRDEPHACATAPEPPRPEGMA
jgi:hypothetical protein